MAEKLCVLYDNKVCNNCGECDICDLDSTKKCDNCGKCIDYDENCNFVKIEIEKIIMNETEEEEQ